MDRIAAWACPFSHGERQLSGVVSANVAHPRGLEIRFGLQQRLPPVWQLVGEAFAEVSVAHIMHGLGEPATGLPLERVGLDAHGVVVLGHLLGNQVREVLPAVGDCRERSMRRYPLPTPQSVTKLTYG